MSTSVNTSIPRIRCPDAKTALLIYYSYPEIGNAQIKELFGSISPNTIVRLKELAREQMTIDGKLAWRANYVNTQSAFKAWGLNVAELEESFKKLQKLKLISVT